MDKTLKSNLLLLSFLVVLLSGAWFLGDSSSTASVVSNTAAVFNPGPAAAASSKYFALDCVKVNAEAGRKTLDQLCSDQEMIVVKYLNQDSAVCCKAA